MFEKITHETLTEDINKAKLEGELLSSSADFLLNKLDQLAYSDSELTQNEIEVIEKQLEYHKRMLELQSEFDVKKVLMRNTLKQQISQLLSQMNGQDIVDTDLLDMECKLEQGLFNDSKSIIDEKVNNTDFSLEGITDGFLNYEILSGFETTNNFLNYFTLELLNNDILIDESRNNISNQVTFSSLSYNQIENYIYKTLEYLIQNNLSFPEEIEIDINNSVQTISLMNIKNEILRKIDINKQKEQEIALQEAKEKNKEYLLGLLEKLFSGDIDSQGLDVLERKFGYSGNLDNGENEGYVQLLNHYVEKGLIDKQYVGNLYDKGVISKIILLNFLEEDKNFNYVEFIENFGITDKIKEVVLDYSRTKLDISEDIDDKTILENLTLFLLTFIMIESSGYNIKNRAGVSTADGYFQYLNANGRYDKNGNWSPGSFQTGLNRTKRFLSKEDFNQRFGDVDMVNNNQNEKEVNPSSLSAENQTLLFFLDIVENGKPIGNVRADDMMTLILSERNSWALGRIYMLLHHTDPDKNTVEVYEREKNKYYYGDKKYIAKNHY